MVNPEIYPERSADLSEARFHKSVKSGEVHFARSIEPFEGGRWRVAADAG
jgi:hypothetical protein